MVFVQKSNFIFFVFFCRIYVKKDHFLIFWIEKNDCQTRKVTFQNVPKNQHFPKGSVYSFCPKIQLFLMSVFCRNYVKKDYVFSIIEREREKKKFFHQKSELLESAPKSIFSTGLVYSQSMVFFQKSNFFLCLFFVVIMSKKIMFSRYSRTKNRLSRPQKKNVQKVEMG